MPSIVEVNTNTLRLSPHFRYRVLDGTIYAGHDQGVSGEITNEGPLKPGDWIDSPDHVVVTAVGTARIEQYSSSEADPPETKTKKGK